VTRWTAALALAAALAQQPRDLPRTVDGGTASIEGRVVTDEREPRPLRRVRVVLTGVDVDLSRTTITDDGGGFAFAGLPPGRYTLSGTKEGYVTVSYGARRPGRPGSPIAVRDRQMVANVTLRLPRGAVITGTLVDADGQPLPGVSMRALRYGYTAAGERRLIAVTASMASHNTDDRGVYRIYGLPAGEYAIAAPVRLPRETDADVVLMTEADIRRGLEELKAPSRPQPLSADAATVEDAGVPAGYAPVFYPGTTVASQAATIAVAQGEERRQVDFAIQFVPMSTIRGTVLAGEGVSSEFIKVMLVATGIVLPQSTGSDVRSSAVTREGNFNFANVAPGQYTVIARGTRGPAAGGAPVFWASTDVVADGQVQQDLTLSLQPALTVAGRIAFEGETPPPNWERVRVTLTPVLAGSQVSLGTAPAIANGAGQFTIGGLTAARYRLQATVTGQSLTWMLKSALVNGRDSLDGPFDLRASVDGVMLTLTDRPSEVTGTVRDDSGQPAAGCSVVMFPPDRAQWIPGTSRIRAVASAVDGSFTLRSLPAGDYAVAAVADAEEGEWFDPAFLEKVVTSSAGLRLAPGDKKTQPLVCR
jgi:uncharacterized protein (DUF2141 family)